MARKRWTRRELLLVLNLYCKLPFSKFDSSTPEIIQLSSVIERTSGAIAMKLSNFASLDDSLPQSGLANASRLDKEIWKEFTDKWGNVAIESEELLNQLTNEKPVSDTEIPLDSNRETEKTSIQKTRVGQQFFRSTILGNYHTRCCICGLPIPSLLIASHIIPWKVDAVNRLNPHNGMSLCAIHDKAFDRGFLTLDEEFRVVLSADLSYFSDESIERFFIHYQHKPIQLPEKFTPKQDFLEYHRNQVFL